MLTYELAKQLKDAGFKQYGNGTYELSSYSTYTSPDSSSPAEKVYFPTLSELIEACPKVFKENEGLGGYEFDFTLNSSIDADGKINWFVGYHYMDGWYESERGEGSTPEIAVVALYVALNKK